ncbi:MAG: hypothetical protein KF912_06550 [Phycisphaeraceae bacterium]|nr:hypothetical protein [Phycisphaeraceae bacterium]
MPIDEWGDLCSLSSPHDVEASSGAEPNIVVPSLRGIPRVEFNGSTDFMFRSPVDFDADATAAFGAVFKTSATAPAHIIGRWNDSTAADHQWRLFYDGSAMSSNVEAAAVQKDGSSHTGFSLVGTSPAATTPLMLIYRFIGGSGAQIWANGKLISSDMAIPFGSDNTDATDTLTLGARDAFVTASLRHSVTQSLSHSVNALHAASDGGCISSVPATPSRVTTKKLDVIGYGSRR